MRTRPGLTRVSNLGGLRQRRSCRHTVEQTPECKQCSPVPLCLGELERNCDPLEPLTSLLWLYNPVPDIFLLVGESLKVEKSSPEPKGEAPRIPICEERLTTRDLCSGVEASSKAGMSNSVK